MQISTKFTLAIHILVAIDYFSKTQKVTSEFLSKSSGSNPVIIRNIMSDLKKAKLINSKRGSSGITLTKPLNQITFYDVYIAVENNNDELFNFHNNPNYQCPIGRNIHLALDPKLQEIQNNFEDDLKKYKLSDISNIIYQKIEKENQKESE